jgi:aromatic-L-amino-acid decarboxylase
MDADEFRAAGHELVEWCAAYLESVEDVPVRPSVEPGWVRARLPPAPPAGAEPWTAVLHDLDRVVRPALTHWQSPRFHGYFPCNTSPAAILAELTIATLGQQGMLWATSPAATELEQHVCDWLVDLLGLPAAWRHDGGAGGGVITDAASTATFTAVCAARDAAGAPVEQLTAYASVDAHSSVEKALRLAGFRPDQLRMVPVDDRRRLDVGALRDAVAADAHPFLVVSTIGTTSFMAVDPVADVGAVARERGLWHHVDAAMAGTAGLSPRLRPLVTAGLDTADSYCVDPHKWLGTGMDCDVLFVRDKAPLIRSMSVVPEYLRNALSERGEVVDFRDWGVPLGRRFRALKLWFLLRLEGAGALRAMVERHDDLAIWLAARVEAHPALDLVVPRELPLVCLAHVDGDDATQRLIDGVNDDGALVTHTRLDGRLVLRVCTAQRLTEQRHLDALWSALTAAA